MTIFGYTWDEIKRVQQGGDRGEYQPGFTNSSQPNDWELLERYSRSQLREPRLFRSA